MREHEARIRAQEARRVERLHTVFARWAGGGAMTAGVRAEWFDVDVEAAAAMAVRNWGGRADFIVIQGPGQHIAESGRQVIHAAPGAGGAAETAIDGVRASGGHFVAR